MFFCDLNDGGGFGHGCSATVGYAKRIRHANDRTQRVVCLKHFPDNNQLENLFFEAVFTGDEKPPHPCNGFRFCLKNWIIEGKNLFLRHKPLHYER